MKKDVDPLKVPIFGGLHQDFKEEKRVNLRNGIYEE